jgi:hypothetical protein
MPSGYHNLIAKDSSIRKMATHPSSKTRHAIQKLIYNIHYTNPDVEITRIDTLPNSPHKAYILTTAKGWFMLKTLPPSGTRVMRHERKCPASEAKILQIVGRVDVPVPMLVSESSKHDNHLNSSYLLRSYIPGEPLSAVAHRFTSYDMNQIDQSIGRYMRNVTMNTQSQFGLFWKVLAGEGYSDWRTAFQYLLEAALRDAEDAVLTIPYESIRYWVCIHLPKLDVVRVANMVPLRTGCPETVIVNESKTIVGMVGWAEVVWGDPALGEVFGNASEAFWHGFGGKQILLYGDGYDEIRHNM